jgi:hypothetical protein
VDPVAKEYESTFACLGNSPIWLLDILGDDTGRVFILQSRWPNVFKTHLMGAAKNPSLVKKNGRIYLTYDPNRSNARKRRSDARRCSGISCSPATLDEFPYASTTEGGCKTAHQQRKIHRMVVTSDQW